MRATIIHRTGCLIGSAILVACGGGGNGGASASAPAITPAPVIQNVTTGAATNVTDVIGTLNGSFTNSPLRVTEAWFEWGTSTAYGNQTSSNFYGYSGAIRQETNLSGLNVNNTYHYTFCTKNTDGKVCGLDRVFSPVAMQIKFSLMTAATNPVNFSYDSNAFYVLFGGSSGYIKSYPLDGSPGSVVTNTIQYGNLALPYGIAVDGPSVYWTEQGLEQSAGVLRKTDLSGAGSYVDLVRNLINPQFVVVRSGYVYYSLLGTWDGIANLRRSDGAIYRVPAAGGEVQLIASNLDGPASLAVDGANVYWTEVANYLSGASRVRSVPISGGVIRDLVTGLTGSQNIVVDASNVYYWSSYGTLSRVPLDGVTSTSPTVQLASGLNGTPRLFSDAGNLYWTETVNGGTVKRLDKATGAITVLTSGVSNSSWIAVNGPKVYWMEDDVWDGSKWKQTGALKYTLK